MKPNGTDEETGPDGIFTEKQCRVLDLLIENKTSKEIARTLGISPYTVDQRISLARGRLGVSSRNELAARYRAMRRAVGGPHSDVASTVSGRQSEESPQVRVAQAPAANAAGSIEEVRAEQERHDYAPTGPERAKISCPTGDELDYRVGPEVFEGASGGLWRIGAIVVTALLIVMTVLGLFAIFNQLNEMLA